MRLGKKSLVPLKQSKGLAAIRPERAWAVYYPSAGQDGVPVRRRRFFRQKSEAEAFCEVQRAERAALGSLANELTDEVKREALDCLRLLKPTGRSLTEAVTAYLRDHATREASIDLRDAAKELRLRLVNDGHSNRHRRTSASVVGIFCRKFKGMKVAMITTTMCQKWLDDYETRAGQPLSPVAFNSYRRYMAMFFSFCTKRGWATSNPFAGVALKKVKTKVPRLLTPKELETILSESPSDMRLMVGILAQCGLRVSEAARLRWEDILLREDEAYIQIGSDSAKTARRRLTPIPTALRAAIEAARGKEGYVFQPGKGSVNALQLALTKVRSTVKGASWGRNAFRASALSYRLALTKDAAATALEMGNSPGILMTAYRELTTRAEAEKWFSVRV